MHEENDIIDIIVINKDLKKHLRKYPRKSEAEISPSDEPNISLLDVVEKKDDNNNLYITQNTEFYLTQLRSEKGFRINKDGSITRASDKHSKLTLHYEEVYECKHETTADCKRSLIFDVNFSVAIPEWISTSNRLSRENSNQTHKNIIVEKNFIEDVGNVVNDEIPDDDKINKLCEISGKYGHFYARRLILGGTIIRNEKHTKNSVKIANILKPEVGVIHGNTDMYNNYNNSTKNFETIIGGNETEYSQDDKNPWKQSLNDEAKWKIIGYEEVYSLFELLDDELKKKVLSVMGHQILEVIVIHHIHGEKTIMPSKVKEVKIKLGWIIIGPPASFDFSIQYPLIFKSGKYQPLRTKDNHMINNHCMFGTCVLEATNNTPQVENSSVTGIPAYDQIKYDPRCSTFAIGNYLTRCQKSICQESAWLFIYDIKTKKKVTVEKVVFIYIVDTTNSSFGEVEFSWEKGPTKKILCSSEKIKTPNDNLILVNQIFDQDDCEKFQPLGFVNIISDQICYGSLNSEHTKYPNIGKKDGLIYVSIFAKK
ncbi:16455_t:CDS:2 [Dentiscutata erythropus]|uniref:16455_t:CDS:1 n=1 Tax=Dentiscutata erythropus TaxID=1348616 RepID=A0A9N8VAS6_9GLOM|nr:16455_t:CDS:2 [Dentiscutata erythropus]